MDEDQLKGLKDCAVHNIATREIIDLMKNNVKNTDFQGKNRVFVGIVSRLQYYTSCYIMNRTGYVDRTTKHDPSTPRT